MIEDYSPIYQGDTGAPFAPVFQHKDGSAVDLTTATISMVMQGEQGTILTCVGPWTIDDAEGGQAHYQYQAADVAAAGMWQLYVEININGRPVHADTKLLQILPLPA